MRPLVLGRAAVATVLLFFYGYVVYAFGAGYLSPIALPTPANVVATGVLATAGFVAMYRFIWSAH